MFGTPGPHGPNRARINNVSWHNIKSGLDAGLWTPDQIKTIKIIQNEKNILK